jgi:hypothetical protein
MDATANGGRELSIGRCLDILDQVSSRSPLYANLAKLLDQQLAPQRLPPEIPSPDFAPFLTIGMATYDDYDGVYFSAQAIRLYHPEVTNCSEILILDNNPRGKGANALRRLGTRIENCRYLPFGSFQGTTVKDLLFRSARGQFVLSMDSHVMFTAGSLARLVDFLHGQKASGDLWQGPMLSDDLMSLSSHFRPKWSGGMYGCWADKEDADGFDGPPFEIPMQGMGVFTCRREAWPGFNPRFSGFGGEEGYIHEKFRRRGDKTLCLPFLRWLHRFDRPMGIPYRPEWKQRIRNYLIGWSELGLDIQPVIEHFETHIGQEATQVAAASTRREMEGPFHAFDAVYSTARAEETESWAPLDLDSKIRFMPALETPYNPEIGSALAHRAILAEAKLQRLASVLVFDSDFDCSENAVIMLGAELSRVHDKHWSVLALRGATAYREGAYDGLLDELPSSPSAMALWLKKHGTLREYSGDSCKYAEAVG